MSHLPYGVRKKEAETEMEKLFKAFIFAFPDAKMLDTDDKLSFAIDCGMKSFICRYPVFDDDYYEVIILTYGDDSKTKIINVETFNEIFELFRTMK